MKSPCDAFWGNAPLALRLGFVGFLIAAVGAAIAFSIDYGPDNPWSYVAFSIVAAGVLVGFVAIGWGWFRFFTGGRP